MSAALALALLALTATADVPVSPPLPLGSADSPSLFARAVATDGRDFLAVWEDRRGATGGTHTAIVRDGEPQPGVSLGFRIHGDAAAVWNGESYLVAATGSPTLTESGFAYVARISRDGALLGAFVRPLGSLSLSDVAIAANGADVVAAWLVPADVVNSSIVIAHIDGNIDVVTTLAPKLGLERVRLVRAGGGFVLLAQKTNPRGGVLAWRLDAKGQLIGGPVALIDDAPAAGVFGAAAAPGGTIVVDSITQATQQRPFGVLRTRVFDFELTHERRLPDVILGYAFMDAAIVCDAGCTAVVSGGTFAKDAGSRALSVDPLRGTVGAPEELLTGFADPPRFAWNGESYLMLYNDAASLRAQRCDALLHPREGPRSVVVERKQQLHAAAASRNGRALVLWQEGFGDAPADLMASSFDGAHSPQPCRSRAASNR